MDVGEWVDAADHDVGQLARFERTEAVGPAETRGGGTRRGDDGFHRGQPSLAHQAQFA